jgi:hypothetical protein
VVVVVDSNKQRGRNIITSSSPPTLHFVVITGINETTAGGARRFFINDPAVYYSDLSYSETDLRYLIALPYFHGWSYSYGNQQVGQYPAYILKVQGD